MITIECQIDETLSVGAITALAGKKGNITIEFLDELIHAEPEDEFRFIYRNGKFAEKIKIPKKYLTHFSL